MKKALFLAVALTATIMANAQTSVQLGYLLNTQKVETAIGSGTDSYSGLFLSADRTFGLAGDLAVTPGLGLCYSFDSGDDYRELGLFLPVDVNYRLRVSDAVSLSVFAGPTFHFGLISEAGSHNYYADDNSRFEVLLGGGLWCDIRQTVRLKAGYKFGLINTSKISGITEKNDCLYLSVGYLF